MDAFNASLPQVPDILNLAKLAKAVSNTDTSGGLYLGGGGSDADEANLWNEAFKPGQRIVIWPFAQPRDRWDGILKWLTGALAKRGDFSSISLFGSITLVDAVPGAGLDAADVVVIPGGNTFELLALLRSQNLLDELRTFVSKGGKVYGGSAGAIIMGQDISLAGTDCGGMDENTIALRDTQGLGLLGDIAIHVHYEDPSTSYRYEAWAKEKNVRVLCLPEKSGVVVDVKEKCGKNAGPADVVLFGPEGGSRNLKTGDTFTF